MKNTTRKAVNNRRKPLGLKTWVRWMERADGGNVRTNESILQIEPPTTGKTYPTSCPTGLEL